MSAIKPDWREAMGIHPDCERAQPGHTRGLALLYAVMALCAAAYVYAAFRGV